jgi:hypothetical protein
MFDIDTEVALRFIGFGFMVLWAIVRAGVWKGWYWRTRGGVYAYLPLGVIFVLYTYRDVIEERLGPKYTWFIVFMFLLGAVCFWWSLRPPAIIQPAWVRWVEKHPSRIRKAMADAVEDDEDWEEHVQSRGAVNRWAQSLARKLPKSKR